MAESPALIEQQREFVHAFHRAVAERVRAEAEALQRLRTRQSDASAKLAKVKNVYVGVNSSLWVTKFAELNPLPRIPASGLRGALPEVEMRQNDTEQGDDPELRLSQCLAIAIEAAGVVERTVHQWFSMRDAWFRRLAIAIVLIGTVIIMIWVGLQPGGWLMSLLPHA